jgi:cytoskeletal protein CcmA (bactofilin family)
VHTGGAVVVGESAIIKGIISAGSVVVSGRVKGTVTAVQKVEIQKGGFLVGDIHSPAVCIEDGGDFHGMCDMGTDNWVEDEQTPPGTVRDTAVHDLAAHRGKVKGQET